MALKANYETVMVFSMKQGEDGIQALIEKFKALIEKHATLQGVDEWGKRKLAYLINKEAEGYYVLMNFETSRARLSSPQSSIVSTRSPTALSAH